MFGASEQGFAGPVHVDAAFDEDGKISYIAVGDDAFAETQGFGARALEAEEQIKFIGLQMPLELENLDALAGATFTKTAIVNALNNAYAQTQTPDETKAAEPEAVTPEDQPGETEPDALPDTLPEETAGAFVGEALSFSTAYRVEAELDGRTVDALRVYEAAVGGEAAASAREAAYQEYFIGKALPLDAASVLIDGVPAYAAQAVAIALNSAYANAPDADSTVWLPMEKADGADGVYTGEAIAFFTEYRAYLTVLPDGTANTIELYERPAGTENWAYSPMTQAFEERPLALPLPTEQNSPYAAAAAIAVNQAYTGWAKDNAAPGPAPLVPEDETPASYTGECIVFFQRIEATASFQDGKLLSADVTAFPLNGADQPVPFAAALLADLTGQDMPLDAAEIAIEGQPDYLARAIAIALNDAYNASLAGQQ